MPGLLTDFDREVVGILREAGVLQDYEPVGPNGQIVVACSDGDQMKDLLIHKWIAAIRAGTIFRPHLLCAHGGAMNIDEKCELYPGLDSILLKHIRQAQGQDLKGITTMNLSIHVPCGAARIAYMTLIHQIWHQYHAARAVQAIDPNDLVLTTLQVDYGEDPQLVSLSFSQEYRRRVQEVQDLADRLGVRVLIPLLDTHRRRTYRIERENWIVFWNQRGKHLWEHVCQNAGLFQ